MGMRLAVLGVAAALAASCGKTEPATSRTVSDDELAAMESRIMTRVEANQTRVCSRPLLHGAPHAGSAIPDQLALSEPPSDVSACLSTLANIQSRSFGPASKGPRPLVDRHAPEVVALDAACGPTLEALVVAAISHEDACSAYQTGVHAWSRNLMPLMRVGHLLGVRALRRADAGDPAGALWLVADTVRWYQDLGRGHVNLLIAMIATGGTDLMLRYAADLIEVLPARAATELAPAFDALLASEARFSDILAGEQETVALHMGLAQTKPATWIVPGGKSELTEGPTENGRTAGAAIMETTEQLLALMPRVCADESTYADCWRGMVAYHFAIDGTSPLLGPMLKSYVERRAQAGSHLAAARIALEVRRDGHCPSPGDLASPRYSALRSPAILGDMLRASVDKTSLRLAPPLWADSKNVSWTIRCP
jgi:hypothetical protein